MVCPSLASCSHGSVACQAVEGWIKDLVTVVHYDDDSIFQELSRNESGAVRRKGRVVGRARVICETLHGVPE